MPEFAMQTAPQSSIVLLCQAVLCGILRPFGRLTTVYAVSNVPFYAGFAVFDYHYGERDTCSMRPWRHDQVPASLPGRISPSCLWLRKPHATGERAQASLEIIIFDQQFRNTSSNVSKPATPIWLNSFVIEERLPLPPELRYAPANTNRTARATLRRDCLSPLLVISMALPLREPARSTTERCGCGSAATPLTAHRSFQQVMTGCNQRLLGRPCGTR